ncbi:hypothetical protein LOZ66_002192 [Ophidiomyces ophidiicola]|nr:hypothetical protein LOZ66_002192 [Ophidiomyces ophidiicola]
MPTCQAVSAKTLQGVTIETGNTESPSTARDGYSSEEELDEAENAFNSVEKDANGAYKVFKKQILALRLRPLEAKARRYCAGRRIKNESFEKEKKVSGMIVFQW